LKGIYRFYFDCGRMGELSGIFVADDTVIAAAIGKEVRFGEALGKHSEVEGELSEDDIKLLTDNPQAVEMFEVYKLQTGYNPLDYFAHNEDS
jgi:hypothetical protein